jgi:NAD(P)-dependent dehydrogenase (short-subunit alcohol dehydrogenase family)
MRIALVTGGAQGIGLATARRFLETGFAGVMLLDRNGEGLAAAARDLGGLGEVETFRGDLMDCALPALAVNAVRKRFGRLDVLVNAAGNTERCGLDDTTPESFERLFGANVRAPLFLMQEAARLMRPRGAGVIINVSSMLSYGGPPNLATYSASKAALCTLTRAVANGLKREGIRVFAINLGWVASAGEHRLQTSFHGMPENWAELIGARMPAGRLISPEDVAGVMEFLVSKPAFMMTGAIIDYEQMPAGVFDTHPALAPP